MSEHGFVQYVHQDEEKKVLLFCRRNSALVQGFFVYLNNE